MLASYSDLKTGITSWLDVSASDLSSQIDDLVTLAETRIFRETRTQVMETAFSGAITNGTIATPAGYLALKNAYIVGNPTQRLERRSVEWIYDNFPNRSSDTRPRYIAREGSNFIFGPYADSAYTVTGVYYQKPAAISSAVNALFTTNPDLYLFACLAESEPLIGRDPRVALWEAKYKNILADVNGIDDAEDQSGSGLQIRAAAGQNSFRIRR